MGRVRQDVAMGKRPQVSPGLWKFLGVAFIWALMTQGVTAMDDSKEQRARATFAGGCFWRVGADFEKAHGVLEAISGYTGGNTENAT